ncbi:MAG: alpha-D-ribose 1-methylphosphonate 5-triphosphate diphosphatase [Anaerolineae bacterium]|nr:alpha-D-ribose 1-methylphosphonate 5-triphosphate diphosphatase [Anaerolineae bacterium]
MWLSDGRLVLPNQVIERGSLCIEDGQIAKIIEGPIPHADLSLRGLTVFPGLVDMHGDMLEREIEPRPRALFPIDVSLYELDKRMVGAGVTTAFAAISFHWHSHVRLRSEEWARQIIDTVNRLRSGLLADFHIHARFEVTNPDAGPVLTELIRKKQVHLISLMDHTPGQGQYRDIERYIQTMIEWRKVRIGIEVTEEEMREHIQRTQDIPKSWDLVSEVARIAAQHHIPLASHDDDTTDKVEFVNSLGTTISEFPVTLEAARAAKRRGMHIAMGAPNALLGRSNTNNLSALAGIEAGVVDILAADYHPGAMLQAACNIAEQGILSLSQAANLVSLNPAHAIGLLDRGSLQVGKRADLVLVEMNGRPRIRATFRQGMPVFSDHSSIPLRTVEADPFAGQLTALERV